jgi:hypothetical protein
MGSHLPLALEQFRHLGIDFKHSFKLKHNYRLTVKLPGELSRSAWRRLCQAFGHALALHLYCAQPVRFS